MALTDDDPLVLEAIAAFERSGFEYMLKLSANMMWVTNKEGRRYAYYPTTGRWSTFGNRYVRYRSRGVEDFIERFMNKVFENNDNSNLH